MYGGYRPFSNEAKKDKAIKHSVKKEKKEQMPFLYYVLTLDPNHKVANEI